MIRAGLIILTVTVSACASMVRAPDARSGQGCDVVGECAVQGRLSIILGVPYSGGRLVLDDGRCLPVALSAEVLSDRERWNERRVSVWGVAFERSEGPDVVSIEYNDRWLPAGLCPAGSLVLYANRLSFERLR